MHWKVVHNFSIFDKINSFIVKWIVSEYNNKKFLTLDSLRSLPQGRSIRTLKIYNET